MPALPFDVVAFDLDGTLADTAPDLAAALNHTLGRLGRPGVAPEAVRHLVGHGARTLLRKGLAASPATHPVTPAKAGVHPAAEPGSTSAWIPAFAGMTEEGKAEEDIDALVERGFPLFLEYMRRTSASARAAIPRSKRRWMRSPPAASRSPSAPTCPSR